MNDLSVCWWPTDRPIPYVRNSRKIPERAIDKVAGSIQEFGWRQSIVVDNDGVIICGHTRLLAAKKLGLVQVPVHVAENLTPAQVKAYRLMDNRSHEETDWDLELLGLELEGLQGLDFDLRLTGFDVDELAEFMAGKSEGLTDEDACPEAPVDPVTVLGDCWLLGAHRLMCGDSTAPTCVEPLLNGVSPHLMVTDPPYGVQYDPEWRAQAGVNENRSKMGKVQNDDRADWREAWQLFPGTVAYIWHAGKLAATVQASLESCGFEIRSQIIWAKDRFALSRGNYHWQHEPCWYAARGGAHWKGDRSQSTLWQIKAREDGGHGHGTQKPVECMKRPIENNSSPGQVIYDPFLGSGTTVIAAQKTGRICYGLELDPEYCDVIITRWQDFTGQQATLEADGRTLEQVKAARVCVAA